MKIVINKNIYILYILTCFTHSHKHSPICKNIHLIVKTIFLIVKNIYLMFNLNYQISSLHSINYLFEFY